MHSPLRILLADDHVMFRRGVRKIIQGMDNVEVVGEAGDGLELLRLIKDLDPNLIIMDISMPNLRGLEATREIKSIDPQVKVLILTMHKDREYLYHALTAGAEGYLLKEDADSELISAIETLRKGGTFISSLLSTQMADIFVDKFRPGGESRTVREEPLTTREREIIKLIAEGKSSKEIGDLLFISSRTVQHHRANVMRKLNLKKTADLVKYAIKKGYVMPSGL
ncbi:MAG: response regulator transcription factor [Deltaproteobacteria bacterium]|jgi:DNA-binding NarL/FixJ family response regulator